MTLLIAGGDSFTYGSELPGQEYAWANLLADHNGWNICNTAKPGASNNSIRRRVMNAVHKYQHLDLRVAVMWSFPNRYEFRFAYDTGHVDSPWYDLNPFTPPEFTQQSHKENADIKGINDFANSYVHNIAIDPIWETYTTFLEITTLQNFLLKHSIPFVFTCVDSDFLKTRMDTSTKVLYEDINFDYWAVTEGMYTWSKRTKQPHYVTHPTEIAHKEWINTNIARMNEVYGYS